MLIEVHIRRSIDAWAKVRVILGKNISHARNSSAPVFASDRKYTALGHRSPSQSFAAATSRDHVKEAANQIIKNSRDKKLPASDDSH
jgi:hypothetical protein